MADWLLDQALADAGLEGLGISTHSFRRTALTNLSNAGVPLRMIQEINGHRSLTSLQRYLEVSPEHKECGDRGAGVLTLKHRRPRLGRSEAGPKIHPL